MNSPYTQKRNLPELPVDKTHTGLSVVKKIRPVLQTGLIAKQAI
ncbi:MAG: hypothetical protein ABSE16_04335 [Verrucomicrobiota bacterium]|jgi:hypothetical protein